MEPCPCCGVAIVAAMAAEVGSCELCAGYPYAPSGCNKHHADGLRMQVLERVAAGTMTGWQAVAAVALDDAHWVGQLREEKRGGGYVWVIVKPAPDPDAWERLSRVIVTDRTIRETVALFVGEAPRYPWSAAQCRELLAARLSWLSRSVGCTGIWCIEVEDAGGLNVQPPVDFIAADTPATRIQTTKDGLAREARLN